MTGGRLYVVGIGRSAGGQARVGEEHWTVEEGGVLDWVAGQEPDGGFVGLALRAR